MKYHEWFRKPVEEFLYAYSFSLGMVSFHFYSDKLESVHEIEHYIPITPSTNVTEHFDIRFFVDKDKEESIRNICLRSDDIVFSKPEFSYRTIKIEDERLYASDCGFLGSEHSIIVSENRIAIIGSKESVDILRMPLRIVREVFLRSLENNGGCFAHGAAVAFNEGEKGVVIVGNNGTGKTSIMWNLIQHKGVEYIANDRCILQVVGEKIKIYGWPLAIRLGIGTLGSLGKQNGLTTKGFRREQAPGLWNQRINTEIDAINNWGNKDKLELTPREIHDLKGTINRGWTTVDSIIYPNLQIGGGDIKLVPVENEDFINSVLKQNLREPVDEDYLRGFLDIRKVDDLFLINKTKSLIKHLKTKKMWSLMGDPRDLPNKTDLIIETLNL